MIVDQKKVAGLVYVTNIDNTAGGATVYPLLVVDYGAAPPDTVTATMGDGSVTDLSAWFLSRLVATFVASPGNSNSLGIFSSLVGLQGLDSAVAVPAVSLVSAGTIDTFNAVIPAGYKGAFVWGMRHSIDSGYLLAGSSGGGGAVAPSIVMIAPATTNKPIGGTAGVQFKARNAVDSSAWAGGAGYFWIEQLDGAFGDLTIAVTDGTLAIDRWASEGRALIFTNGPQATVTFKQSAAMPAAATFKIGAGPGPGAGWPSNAILGGSAPIQVIYS